VIKALLKEFELVLNEPKQLPPIRTLDHKIPLIPIAKPVNIRPYRGFFIHKEIERLMNEMFFNGVIQPNGIPFTSPIL